MLVTKCNLGEEIGSIKHTVAFHTVVCRCAARKKNTQNTTELTIEQAA
jgi:hypothetical protein